MLKEANFAQNFVVVHIWLLLDVEYYFSLNPLTTRESFSPFFAYCFVWVQLPVPVPGILSLTGGLSSPLKRMFLLRSFKSDQSFGKLVFRKAIFVPIRR